MQRLEHELGVRLFDRKGSGTELTPYGRALVEHAGGVVKSMQRLREHLTDMREGRAGHTAVGAGSGLLEALVSRATAELCTRLPGVRVTAVAGLAEELLPGLQRGDLDMVLGSRPSSFSDPAVACVPLFRDEIGIVVRRGNPLLRRRRLQLADIALQPWVLPSADHTFTKSCVACFAAAGLMGPVPAVVATSVPFIDNIVAHTDFLTFMPLSLAAAKSRAELMRPLQVAGGTWAREVFLFTRSGVTPSPATAALLEELWARVRQGVAEGTLSAGTPATS
jgi:DNA-binding transcriptional LysR family regulator